MVDYGSNAQFAGVNSDVMIMWRLLFATRNTFSTLNALSSGFVRAKIAVHYVDAPSQTSDL